MGRKPSNPRPKKAPCQAYQLEWRTFQVYHEAVQAFRKIQQKQIGTCRAWAEKMSNLPQYEKRKLTTKQKSRILLKPSVRPVTCRNEEFFKSLSLLTYPCISLFLFFRFDFHETISYQRLIKAITTRFVYSTIPTPHRKCLAIAVTFNKLAVLPSHFKLICSWNSGSSCGRPVVSEVWKTGWPWILARIA